MSVIYGIEISMLCLLWLLLDVQWISICTLIINILKSHCVVHLLQNMQ